MYRQTFGVSMRVFGHDGQDCDVDGSVEVEWIQAFTPDGCHNVVVSAVMQPGTTLNGEEPAWEDMLVWQSKYFEDYRSHLQWIVTSVIDADSEMYGDGYVR